LLRDYRLSPFTPWNSEACVPRGSSLRRSSLRRSSAIAVHRFAFICFAVHRFAFIAAPFIAARFTP
jgi:hypothetical protein